MAGVNARTFPLSVSPATGGTADDIAFSDGIALNQVVKFQAPALEHRSHEHGGQWLWAGIGDRFWAINFRFECEI